MSAQETKDRDALRELIADGRVHVMDGAMGTEIYASGVFVNVSYDGLNLETPDIVENVHRNYVNAGAEVIGVTCSAFGRSSANEYVSREIATDSLDQRLDTLIATAVAYIVLDGGTGTLLELAKVWELKNKGFLDGDKPIILVGEFWVPLLKLIEAQDPKSLEKIQVAKNPKEAVKLLKEYKIPEPPANSPCL